MKISLCRDSSQTWRAMSSWNSHGASGKSKSVRPAASIACTSPQKIPCRRARSASSSKGSTRSSRPCSSRISRTLRARIRMKRSSRASLSTGIIRCMAVNSPVSVGRAASGGPVQTIDFFVGETGEQARLARNGDRGVEVYLFVAERERHLGRRFARGAATLEVEEVVDVRLEVERALEAFGVALGQLAHPLRAHAHVGDLVGQHVVDGAFDNRVTHPLREPDDLLEDVAGESFETAVDTGDTCGGVVGLGAGPQHFAFRKFAEVRADVFEQLREDFEMARLVPDLARHVELKFPRSVGEIEERAPRRLHRLHLARRDPMQAELEEILLAGQRAGQGKTPVDARLEDACTRHHDAIVRACELVDRYHLLHGLPLSGSVLRGVPSN